MFSWCFLGYDRRISAGRPETAGWHGRLVRAEGAKAKHGRDGRATRKEPRPFSCNGPLVGYGSPVPFAADRDSLLGGGSASLRSTNSNKTTSGCSRPPRTLGASVYIPAGAWCGKANENREQDEIGSAFLVDGSQRAGPY